MYEKELLDESFWPGDGYVTTPDPDGAKITAVFTTATKANEFTQQWFDATSRSRMGWG